MIPVGYRAYLLSVVNTLDELSAVTPLEESGPEGALMLMRLDFAGTSPAESLAQIEQGLVSAGVPAWPGQGSHVRAEGASVYISWVKGFAWMSVITGILALTILPLLLGGLVWMALPETVKEMINMMVVVGVMMLMMKFMSGATKEEAGK